MLKEFDVEKFYVHDVSLAERGLGLNDLLMDVEIIDGTQIAELLESVGTVLPF
jgi:sulfur relay (sulfurtransferase) DsrF/TusC family protein